MARDVAWYGGGGCVRWHSEDFNRGWGDLARATLFDDGGHMIDLKRTLPDLRTET